VTPEPRWRRFVAIGDSFTEGLQDELGADGRHRGWADRVAETLDARDHGLEYANLAIRGRLLAQVVDEQVPAAVGLEPDLVTFAAGVNDAIRRRFDLDAAAAALDSGVATLRSTGADVVVFRFGDPSRRSRAMATVRDRIAAYNAVTDDVARRHGCLVVSFWGLAAFDDDRFWDEDRLHLSPAGHQRAAGAVLEALGVGDDTWRTPPAPGPRPGPFTVAADHARWTRRHFAPWLVRRARGISSGDAVSPKRPHLAPVGTARRPGAVDRVGAEAS
jgi:lysophospholipase L1-like esterase